MIDSHRTTTVSQWLIRYAARRVPDALSERLEEEWLADLESRSSGLPKLRFAIGCCWAMRVIANDTQLVGAAATATATSPAVLTNLGLLSRRSSTLLVVAIFHAGLAYLVIHSVTHTRGRPPAVPLENQFVKNAEQPPLKPQLAAPHFDPVKIDPRVPLLIPPPEQVVAAETSLQTQTQPLPPPQTSDSEPNPPPAAAHVVQRVAGGTGAGFPNADDFYPLLAKRLEEQGLATVTVCVDPRGRLTEAPAISRSSGSSRLDEGALKLARAGSGHYRAATEDGKPVTACYPLAIRFKLN